MLSARDQENLVHGHLAAAASKPLNQGTRQLPPKTPGKVPKTPFKLPLNDENGGRLGGGKAEGKAFGKGNENMVTGAKKGGSTDKFTTPMGTSIFGLTKSEALADLVSSQVREAEHHWA